MRVAHLTAMMGLLGVAAWTSVVAAQPGAATPKVQVPAARPKGAPASAATPSKGAVRAPGDAVSDQARKLYTDGVKAAQQKRWSDAYAAFLGAWALNKHYTIAGSLGTCELELGKPRDAAEHLAINAREIEKDNTATATERANAAAVYAQARAKVGTVVLRSNVDGAEVLVDGGVVGKAPLEDPVFVEPGRHTVTVRHEGYEPAELSIDAVAGGAIDKTVELKPPPVAEAPPSPVMKPHYEYDKKFVVAGGVTAGVGIVAGVVFSVLALNERGNAEDLRGRVDREQNGTCPRENRQGACAELRDAVLSQYRLTDVAGAGFVVGAVGIGLTIYGLVHRVPVQPKPVEAQAFVGPGAMGMSVRGVF